MSNIRDATGLNRSPEEMLSAYQQGLRNPESTPYGGGGGDGTMEHRLEAIERRLGRSEDKLDQVGTGISDLKGIVGKLEGKISMLPGYPGMAVLMSIVGGALVVITKLMDVGATP